MKTLAIGLQMARGLIFVQNARLEYCIAAILSRKPSHNPALRTKIVVITRIWD